MAVRNQKKCMLMFVGVRLQHQFKRMSITPKTRTRGNGYSNSPEDVRILCKQGRLKEALNILNVMDQLDILPDFPIYSSLLHLCLSKKALPEGKLVHTHMSERGFMPDIFLANKILTMYSKCGSLVDARRVLDQMSERNVVSWTTMIAAYARHGFADEALKLFHEMQQAGVQPNQYTFASVLPACASLASMERGKEIHEEIVKSGFESVARSLQHSPSNMLNVCC